MVYNLQTSLKNMIVRPQFYPFKTLQNNNFMHLQIEQMS